MSDLPRPLPPKKDVAEALLEGPSVFVHLDPRRTGVNVPKWFQRQPQLVLQIGLNMAIPIPDLRLDDEGITCTLSFSRTPFWCSIPWSCVYALVGEDGRGMVWPDDVPPEVAVQMQRNAAQQQQPKAAKKARPKLSAVEGGAGSAEREAPAELESAERPPAAKTEATSESDEQPERETKEGSPAPILAIASAPKPSEKAEESRDESEDGDQTPKPKPTGSKKAKRELPPYLRVIK